MSNNLIGMAVQFNIKGQTGDGIITGYCESPEQWEIRYSYEVDEGTYKGRRIVSTICACREEMIKVYPVKIDKFWVIGTNYVVYNVYEPSIPIRQGAFHGHSTITHVEVDGKIEVYGRIGTNDLPAEINAFPPMTDERIASVRAFHQAQYDRAINLIYARYWDHLHDSIGQLKVDFGEIEEYFPTRDLAKEWGNAGK